MSSHELTHLLHQYGCGLVFVAAALQAVGFPVPGTTALVLAALYAAATDGLPIAWVIVAAALGALAGTSAGFALGRWRSEQLLAGVARVLRQSPERLALARREFAAHGRAVLFFGRFVTGVRNFTGLVAGASGMPLSGFLPVSAAAAAAWALSNGLEYYLFGHALATASTWVQVVLVVAGLAWLALTVVFIRRRAVRRIRALESPP